ncbi:MAG: hypothetical protein DHS80DRAFT_24822 [Piptocephalis tieghemiana]|nr:MAG: hypothetical protein DHS80DRAFT_24822 [Piptocephalis tieghemiana]
MGYYWFADTRHLIVNFLALPPPPPRPRRWLDRPYFNGGCGDVVCLYSTLIIAGVISFGSVILANYFEYTTTYKTFRVEGNYPTLRTGVTVDVSTAGEQNAGFSVLSSGTSEVSYVMSPEEGVYTLKVTAPLNRGCFFTFPPHCAAAHVTLLLPLGTQSLAASGAGYAVEVDVGGDVVTLGKGLSMATPLHNLTLAVHRGEVRAEQGEGESGGVRMENGVIHTWDTPVSGLLSPSSSLEVYGQGKSPMDLDIYLRKSLTSLGNGTQGAAGRALIIRSRDEGQVQVKVRGGGFSGQAEVVTDGGYQADLRGPRVELQKSLVSHKVGLCLGTGKGTVDDVAVVSAHVGAATLELSDL